MLLEKQFGVFTFAILGQAHRPCPIYLVTLLSLSLYFAQLCREAICFLASIPAVDLPQFGPLAFPYHPQIEALALCKWLTLLGQTLTFEIVSIYSGSCFLARRLMLLTLVINKRLVFKSCLFICVKAK